MKVSSSQNYGFSNSHVWMWELDYNESWALKNWCFWTLVLEKTLESPLDCQGIKPVNPKGNQSWIFIGRTDAEAEALVLWPPDDSLELIHKERPWCWEILKAEGEGDDRGWDGWMASPTWATWVWTSSRSWWWTRKPGVFRSMGSQRFRHDWVTELNWQKFWKSKVQQQFHWTRCQQDPNPARGSQRGCVSCHFWWLLIFLDCGSITPVIGPKVTLPSPFPYVSNVPLPPT